MFEFKTNNQIFVAWLFVFLIFFDPTKICRLLSSSFLSSSYFTLGLHYNLVGNIVLIYYTTFTTLHLFIRVTYRSLSHLGKFRLWQHSSASVPVVQPTNQLKMVEGRSKAENCRCKKYKSWAHFNSILQLTARRERQNFEFNATLTCHEVNDVSVIATWSWFCETASYFMQKIFL